MKFHEFCNSLDSSMFFTINAPIAIIYNLSKLSSLAQNFLTFITASAGCTGERDRLSTKLLYQL